MAARMVNYARPQFLTIRHRDLMLDSARADAALRTLGARITANPDNPFGMPGVALFACDGEGRRAHVFAGTDSRGNPVTANRTVCLASVGKLAVALLVLELIDRGALTLSTELASVCPEAVGPVGRATMGGLLSHRAGIPPTVRESEAPYQASLTWAQLRATCLGYAGTQPTGTRVLYSDVAYGLLGIVIETVTGHSLHTALESRLNATLGTRLSLGQPPGTEYVEVIGVSSPHRGTAIEPLNSPFWHGLSLPWAGICGRPEDALTLVREFSRAGTLLPESLRNLAVRDPNGGALAGCIEGSQLGIDPIPRLEWEPCAWGLGVELRGHKQPHWTPGEASPASFGHVGVSGTLAWHDPVADVSWAMVGTRSSHSGWLLRYGPLLGRAVLSCVTR